MAIEKNKGTIKFVDNNGNNYTISSYKNTFVEELIKNKGTISLILSNGTILKNSSYKNKINKNLIKRYKVIFKNWDGTILQTSYVEEGGTVEYTGVTPTRPDEDGYVYTFVGWDKEFNNITSDIVVTAQYSSNKPTVFVLNLTDSNYLQPSVTVAYMACTAKINWGDGEVSELTNMYETSSTSVKKSQPYASTGTYTVTVLIENVSKVNNTQLLRSPTMYIYTREHYPGFYVSSASYQEGVIHRINKEAYKFSQITQVTLPSSLKTLDHFAFEESTQLTSITVPASVTNIGLKSLYIGSASNKATIIFEGTTPPTLIEGYDPFGGGSTIKEIRVPMSAVDTYKSDTNWSNYAEIIVGY